MHAVGVKLYHTFSLRTSKAQRPNCFIFVKVAAINYFFHSRLKLWALSVCWELNSVRCDHNVKFWHLSQIKDGLILHEIFFVTIFCKKSIQTFQLSNPLTIHYRQENGVIFLQWQIHFSPIFKAALYLLMQQ